MPVRFDHAVFFVEDLEATSERFRSAGFDVRTGGVHTGGLTRNALIGLADGSYLELLSVNLRRAEQLAHGLRTAGAMGWVLRGRTALDRRLLPRAARGEGLIDWAVATDDLQPLLIRARSWLAGPLPGERRRPDGIKLAWELAMPADHVCPFVIRDVTARSLRVPAASNHPNGASGIAAVTIACGNLDGARRRYTLLLGRDPVLASHKEVVFAIDEVTVVLRERADSEEGPMTIALRDWSASAGDTLVRGIGDR